MNKIIAKLKEAISGTKFENKTFVAGGYVRDKLLNQLVESADLDITVALDNGGIELANFLHKKRLSSKPVVFKNFGTAQIFMNGKPIELVMTRKESYRKNNRNPQVSHASLKEDVLRRDFTINSLLMNISSGEILDLSGQGKTDLAKGIVRATSDPKIIFGQDPLRILRAIRYACRFGFDIAESTQLGMKNDSDKLRFLSSKRVTDELIKIVCFPNPAKYLDLMRELNIWQIIIPELTPIFSLEQNKKYHDNDVWNHTLAVIRNIENKPVLRFAALFHDIGKGVTYSQNDTGIHFYKHEYKGLQLIEKIFERLTLNHKIKREILHLVKNHMRTKSFGNKAEKAKTKTIAKFSFDNLQYLDDLLALIDADNKSHKAESPMNEQVRYLKERIEKECKPVLENNFPLSGKDIMQEFAIEGELVGDLLSFAQKKWLADLSLSKSKILQMIYAENKKKILKYLKTKQI